MMSDTLHTLLLAWDVYLAEQGQAPLTRKRYLAVIRTFDAWFIRHHHIALCPHHLTPIDLTAYRSTLQQSSAAATVNVHVSALRSFCAWLVLRGTLTTNPADRLKTVQPLTILKPQALTAVQVHALLRQAHETQHAVRNYAVLQVLVQTGIRLGECVALNLMDIALHARGGTLTVRHGKGNTCRIVPLNSSVRRSLRSYLTTRWHIPDEWASFHEAWSIQPGMSPLWQSQKGHRLSARALRDMIKRLVHACAVRQLVPSTTHVHTLRHTFATLYLQDYPHDIIGLAALLGHTRLETTRRYVQPSVDELTQRVEQSRLNAYGS